MPQNSNKDIQIRRYKTSNLYLSGKKQSEIAIELGVSISQVSLDLKHLRVLWAKESIAAVSVKVAEELAKIDNLERQYWEAWAKSTKDHTKTINKAKGKTASKIPDYSEITETEVIKDGDPRFLQGIERCIERRCKLLGLDAPAKIKADVEINEHSFIHFLMHTNQ
jgi:hypothetical protein